jgi:2'-5' RNA ligase
MYGQEINKPSAPSPADREISLDEWDDVVADRYKVPRSLFRAIASQESGNDASAVSPTGVRGRRQVTERVAKSYGLDRNDPWQETVASAKYLRDQYDQVKDVNDDNERWLGAVGRYYGGPGAVRGGELSGATVDGVSNPARHVERVAKLWGEINRGEQATTPRDDGRGRRKVGYDDVGITPAGGSAFDLTGGESKPAPSGPRGELKLARQGPRLTSAEKNEGLLTVPRTMEEATAPMVRNAANREVAISGAAQETAKEKAVRDAALAEKRRAYYAQPLYQQVGQEFVGGMARMGESAQRAANLAIRPVMSALGADNLAQQGREAQAATAQRLAEREEVANSLRSKTVRGLTQGGANVAIMAPIAMAGGIPAVMAATGAQADWENDPLGSTIATATAGLPIKVGQAISPVAARVASNFASPIVQKGAQLGLEAAAGAGANLAQYAGTQAALGRPITADDLAEQGITGGVLSTVMAPKLGPRTVAGEPGAAPRRSATARAQATEDYASRVDPGMAARDYVRTVDEINRRVADPGAREAAIEQARADYHVARRAARGPEVAPDAAVEGVAPEATISDAERARLQSLAERLPAYTRDRQALENRYANLPEDDVTGLAYRGELARIQGRHGLTDADAEAILEHGIEASHVSAPEAAIQPPTEPLTEPLTASNDLLNQKQALEQRLASLEQHREWVGSQAAAPGAGAIHVNEKNQVWLDILDRNVKETNQIQAQLDAINAQIARRSHPNAPETPDAPPTSVISQPDAPRTQEVRRPSTNEVTRAEANEAKTQAAQFESEGRFDDAAREYDVAHKALVRLRREMGRPKSGADASELTALDREISGAANNRGKAKAAATQAARSSRQPRTPSARAQKQIENAPTSEFPIDQQPTEREISAGVANRQDNIPQNLQSSPLLGSVVNPEGGVPQAPESRSGVFGQMARRQAAQAEARPQSGRKRTSDLNPIQYLKRQTGGKGIRVSDRGEAQILGAKEEGIVGLTSRDSKYTTHDAQVMLDEGGFTLPDGRAFTDPSVTENDVLSFLRDSGKQARMGTSALDRRLADEEAEYYARQEEAAGYEPQSTSQKFTSGVNKARLDDGRELTVDRERVGAPVERSSPATPAGEAISQPEAQKATPPPRPPTERLPVPKAGPENIDALRARREVLSRLRDDRRGELPDDLADEYRELGWQIHEYKNANKSFEQRQLEEEAPPWARRRPDRPADREAVRRALADAEARAKRDTAELSKTLAPGKTEALEREIQAVDALFADAEQDSDIADLFERSIQGDRNARAKLIQYADQAHGIDAETVGELVDARRSGRDRGRSVARSVDQTRANQSGIERGDSRQVSETPSRPRQLSEREQALLDTIPSDVDPARYDEYLTGLETLRNDWIGGRVDLPADVIEFHEGPARKVGYYNKRIENGKPIEEILDEGGRVIERFSSKSQEGAEEDEAGGKYMRGRLIRAIKDANVVRHSLVKQKLIGPKNAPAEPKAQSLGKAEGGRRLVEQMGAKKTEESEEPRTVVHQNPELDRKPVLAETQDGRVIIGNPNNKSGVSIVKDRSADPAEHKFSSTQSNLPKDLADEVRAFGKRIPDADLAEDGRETEPHITVKYGLHGFDPKFVQEALAGEKAARVKLGKVSLFENDKFDVVKVDVESSDLHRLNQKVSESQPQTETHPGYKPHVTIAYVKKGRGQKYVGDTSFEGREVTLDNVTFSGRDGERTEIPLKAAAGVEKPAEAPAGPQRTLTEVKDLIRKIRQKENAKSERAEFADLRAMKVEGNPFVEGLRQMEPADLAREIETLGGDPARFRGDKDLMTRWLAREIGRQVEERTGAQAKPDAAAEKARFEELSRVERDPKKILDSALNKLGASRDEAVDLMTTLNESARRKGDIFAAPEDQRRWNDAWDKILDNNGNLKVSEREFGQLRALLREANASKGDKSPVMLSARRGTPAPDLASTMRRMMAARALRAAKIRSLEAAAPERLKEIADALGVQLPKAAESANASKEAARALTDLVGTMDKLGARTVAEARAILTAADEASTEGSRAGRRAANKLADLTTSELLSLRRAIPVEETLRGAPGKVDFAETGGTLPADKLENAMRRLFGNRIAARELQRIRDRGGVDFDSFRGMVESQAPEAPKQTVADLWQAAQAGGEIPKALLDRMAKLKGVAAAAPMMSGRPRGKPSEGMSEYWRTPLLERDEYGRLAPISEESKREHFLNARAEFRSHATRGRLYANEQAEIAYMQALNRALNLDYSVDAQGVAVPLGDARETLNYLRRRMATEADPERVKAYENLIAPLDQAIQDADRRGKPGIVISGTRAQSIDPRTGLPRSTRQAVRQVAEHEETHIWELEIGGRSGRGSGLFSEEAIRNDPDFDLHRFNLLSMDYPESYVQNPANVSAEAIAHVVAGQWREMGYGTEAEAMNYLDRTFKRVYDEYGPDALNSLRIRSARGKEVKERYVRRSGRSEQNNRAEEPGPRPSARAPGIRARESGRVSPSMGGREAGGRLEGGETQNDRQVRGTESPAKSARERDLELFRNSRARRMAASAPATPQSTIRNPRPAPAPRPSTPRETKPQSAADYFKGLLEASPYKAEENIVSRRANEEARLALRQAADKVAREKMSDAQQARIVNAADELMMAGRLGDPAEIKKARGALSDAMRNLEDRSALGRAAIRTGDFLSNVLKTTQTLRYGSDVSFAFRQGAPLTTNAFNLLNTARAFKQAYHALGREVADNKTILPGSKGAEFIRKQLEAHPQYELGKKAGLELSLYSHPEEVYSDNIAMKLPWVKRTEAANEAFIDYMRLQEFGKFVKRIEGNASLTDAQRADAQKRAAEVINTLTGRTNLGDGKIRDMANFANGIMGAPRLTVSRIKMTDPTWLAREYARNPEVGKQMARQVSGIALTWGGLLAAGAATGAFRTVLNPEDPDFGKIVSGNTRYDITGGMLPFMKVLSKAGSFLAAAGDETYRPSSRATRHRKEAQTAAVNQMKGYLRSRLGPMASYISDLMIYGEDYERRPVTARAAADPRDPNFAGYRLFAPLGAESIVESAREGGAGRVAKTAPFEFVGINAREYDPKKMRGRRRAPQPAP